MNNDMYDGFYGYDGENEKISCFEDCLDNDDFDIVKVKAITPKSLDANKVWVTDKLFHYFPEPFCSDQNKIAIPQNMDITIRRKNGSKVIDVDSETLYKIHNQELEVVGIRNAEIKKVHITMKSASELKSKYDKIDTQLDLYNAVMRQPLIENFEAVLDKYILKLDNVYNLDGNLTLDVEWEEINHWDKNPSTQTIAEGTVEVKLDTPDKKLLAWAYTREYLSDYDYRNYNISQKNMEDYKEMIIEELLKSNDWEFLK